MIVKYYEVRELDSWGDGTGVKFLNEKDAIRFAKGGSYRNPVPKTMVIYDSFDDFTSNNLRHRALAKLTSDEITALGL